MDEQHGQEYDTGGQRAGRDRTGHLPGPFRGGDVGRVAQRQAAVHGLHHHDGVVHQHAGAERQAAEGDDVQAVLGEVHGEQRREDRYRHRRGDDQRGPRRTQEQRQHQHGKHHPGARGELQIIQGVGDELRVVRDLTHLDARQIVPEVHKGVANLGGHGDGVRPRFLVHGNPDTLDAVHQHQVIDLGIGQFDVAEVRDANRLAAAGVVREVAHDHVGDVIGTAVAGYATYLKNLVAFLQGAGFDIHVLVAQARAEQAQRHAEGIEPVTVDRDPDLELAPAGDPRLGHPGELLQRRRDLAPGQLAKLGEGGLTVGRDQAQGEDRRLAGIEASDEDLVHLGVALDTPNRFLHIDEGEIEVGVPVERHRGHEAAGARHLEDLAAAAHRGELTLHGLAVEAFHLRRRAVARADGDHHRGTLQVGQQIHRQFAPGQGADEGDGQGHDGDRHRAAHGEGGGCFQGGGQAA